MGHSLYVINELLQCFAAMACFHYHQAAIIICNRIVESEQSEHGVVRYK